MKSKEEDRNQRSKTCNISLRLHNSYAFQILQCVMKVYILNYTVITDYTIQNVKICITNYELHNVKYNFILRIVQSRIYIWIEKSKVKIIV